MARRNVRPASPSSSSLGPRKGPGMSTNRRNLVAVSAAASVAAFGLLTATLAVAWVAGSLGISSAAASQIAAAVSAGGLALTLVMAIFGGGVISAIIATVRWYIVHRGKAIAIA